METEAQLAEIVARLTAVARPARVILFGSLATGEATADSDVDLLVLFAQVDDPRSESVRLRRALRGLGAAVDVIVMPEARFEETKRVVGTVAYPADKYGRVIYAAA
jgi:uncharacterized protein